MKQAETNMQMKTVIITGAANGLGRALATEFFSRGYSLALIDIDEKGLLLLKNELASNNQRVSIHFCDVSNEADVVRAKEEVSAEHPSISILINNAGISISQLFGQIALSDFRKLFEINFWGTVYCSKFFLPDLLQQKESRLVNIISDFALMGFPGKNSYGSSKSAVMGFTNSLKTELAETSTKVCMVIPPALDTGLIKNSLHINEAKRLKEAAFLKQNGMPVDKAAKQIASKIIKGKYRIVIGSMMFWIDLASRLFPSFTHWIIGKHKKRIDFI